MLINGCVIVRNRCMVIGLWKDSKEGSVGNLFVQRVRQVMDGLYVLVIGALEDRQLGVFLK